MFRYFAIPLICLVVIVVIVEATTAEWTLLFKWPLEFPPVVLQPYHDYLFPFYGFGIMCGTVIISGIPPALAFTVLMILVYHGFGLFVTTAVLCKAVVDWVSDWIWPGG